MDDDWEYVVPFVAMAFLIAFLVMGLFSPWYAWKKRYAWLNKWVDARERINAQFQRDRQLWLERRKAEPQRFSDPTNQNHNNPGDPCDSCKRPLTGGGGIGPTSCRHEDCDLYDDCGDW